jgi:hypothetical protein
MEEAYCRAAEPANPVSEGIYRSFSLAVSAWNRFVPNALLKPQIF